MKKKPIKKKDEIPTTSINNCIFTGVKWDGISSEVLKDVSEALLNLTKLFKSQNITIDSLLKFSDRKSDFTVDVDNSLKK